VKLDFNLAIDDLREVPALARDAEALGFDGLWTAETKHDPFLPLALAAEHTRRLSWPTRPGTFSPLPVVASSWVSAPR